LEKNTYICSMEKTIQIERAQFNHPECEMIGYNTIHRGMAVNMINSMPIEMLRRIMPLKVGGDKKVVQMEIRIEA
jgi:hypothetical protein